MNTGLLGDPVSTVSPAIHRAGMVAYSGRGQGGTLELIYAK